MSPFNPAALGRMARSPHLNARVRDRAPEFAAEGERVAGKCVAMSYGASAYARASHTALSPREAEAAVLIKAANRLRSARSAWPEQIRGLNEALSFNQKVWSLLSTEATAETSPLPETVKQNVGRLGVFVLRACIDTMIAPTPEKLDALIAINHNIAAGLQGDAG
ncbi:flagellar biosynthesis regulator FlaF [uncultured Methylobacterium sp.]|uniref:flagellar biosynthesis regulator FlaF n=1 Tax=uncultured Methylobacterium sp. TaxID=157278 RepID=UPI0035CC4174